jgi:hypothetical protein
MTINRAFLIAALASVAAIAVAVLVSCSIAGSGLTGSLSRLGGDSGLSPIDVQVLGRTTMLWRAPAAVRVIVTDHSTDLPVRARVSIFIIPPSGSHGQRAAVYSGATNADGTVDASFTASADHPGAHLLLVDVASGIGDDSVTAPLEVDRKAQILLVCDKPVYQPGQVIHMRALARDAGTQLPLAGQPITFEAQDGRGNKVFKDRGELSRFGVASADFQLADEVNMGSFTLRALTDSDTVEKTVQVSRYVLPKFKVSVTTAKPYYLPGQTVSGSVQASYFFGKPLSGATVHLSLSTLDIGLAQLAQRDLVMDDSGSAKFDFTLPDSFVGQPLDQGQARIELAADVTDTANQKQTGSVDVVVVSSPIEIALVPESGTLVPGVENRVYIAAGAPDGRPLDGLHLHAALAGGDQSADLTTDAMGLQTFSFVPASGSATVIVTAQNANGEWGSATTTISSAPNQQGLILRSDRTLAKVGDKLHLTALSSSKSGTLYLDVIRDGQTILTQSAPMKDGEAKLAISVTPDMTGTVELHAYKILPTEDIIRDTRTILVSPADDLTVSMRSDQERYQPGQDAVLDFDVRDKSGHGVAAALGIAIVDESVFALSEMRPGLEQVYFMLEKELMEPKYEIHGLTPAGLISLPEPIDPVRMQGRQTAAAMLLAGAPQAPDFDYNKDSFSPRYLAFVNKTIQPELLDSYNRIVDALNRYRGATGHPLAVSASLYELVRDGYLRASALKDHWGRYYRTVASADDYAEGFTLESAGLDGKWGTNDDILGFTEYAYQKADGSIQSTAAQGSFASAPGSMRYQCSNWTVRNAFGGEMAFDANRPVALADAMAEEAPQAAMVASRSIGAVPAPMPVAAAPAPANDEHGIASSPAPRLRQYFPETMYWNPELITDSNGHAQIRIPMADSITTWRVSELADSESGLLGSGSAPIRVFQDFFVDMDLPISMTQNDRVDLPVVLYNYAPTAQNVTVTVSEAPWFTLEGDASRTVAMKANDVKSVSFPITVKQFGSHALTVTARGDNLSDAVQRTIEVVPDGKEVDTAVSDQIEGPADRAVDIPEDAIAGASSIWVKIYPGAFSQVMDGLDGLLRMPFGCFEQTSSTTYPNVLVLDYMKRAKKINPRIQMTAEQYINIGYQRLLTFECKSGGFSWFGDEPANQILTAYGLLEFSDMSHVSDVDPALLTRTEDWLAGKQRGDGSWLETNEGIAEGIINRQTGALRTTAYVGWALSEAGYKGPAIQSALGYVRDHISEAQDAYTLAVILNFLDSADPNSGEVETAVDRLAHLATTDGKTAYWKSDTQTFTGARDSDADLETTGLAAYALCRSNRQAALATNVLSYLVKSRDGDGTWGTTQGTVWALKSLLWASEHSGEGSAGTMAISANGKPLKTFDITAADSDVMRQVELGPLMREGANRISIDYKGEGAPIYEIAARYYMPWRQIAPEARETGPLSIDVAYDKTTLATDDTAAVTVTIKNNTDRRAEMPLIDLGIPPGFDVISDGLDTAKDDGTIDKYTLAGRQIIVYMQKLDPNATVTLRYKVRAKYPIRAHTPESKVYPYYNPEQASVSKPQEILVR